MSAPSPVQEDRVCLDLQCPPQDIIRNILEMSDAAVVFKCTFVCREWESMIKSSQFVDRYRRSKHREECVFIFSSTEREEGPYKYSLNFGGGSSDDLKALEVDVQCYDLDHHLLVVGCCYGLVAICNLTAEELVLWNPAIRKIRRVAYQDDVFCTMQKMKPLLLFGLGFEEVTDEYNILCYMEHDGHHSTDSRFKFKLYSLTNHSWEDITHHFPAGNAYTLCTGPDQCVLSTENSLNFIMNQLGSHESFLFRFNLGDRHFSRMPLPMLTNNALRGLIRHDKHSVALVWQVNFFSPEYEVWAMRVYETEEWCRILRISDLSHSVEGLVIRNITPVLFEHCLYENSLWDAQQVENDEEVVQVQVHPGAAGIFSCQVESKEVASLATWSTNRRSYVSGFTESWFLLSDEA